MIYHEQQDQPLLPFLLAVGIATSLEASLSRTVSYIRPMIGWSLHVPL